jgi:YggT family protein
MDRSTLGTLIYYVFNALAIAVFLRAIISWFRLAPDNPLVVILEQITEPILAPLRRVIPPVAMMDITPVVAMILLQVLGQVIASNL